MIKKNNSQSKTFYKNTKDLTKLSLEELNDNIRFLLNSKNKNIDKELLLLTKELSKKLSLFIDKINASKNISTKI